MAIRMTSVGLLLGLFVLFGNAGSTGKEPNGKRSGALLKVLGSPNRTHFDINRLQTSFWDQGTSDYNFGRVGDAGLIYPKGSAKTAIFAAGLWWSARYGIGGDLRSGGVSYWSGLRCGKILPGMVAEPDSLPKCRAYRVRRDIPLGNRSADVSSEKLDGEGSSDEIYDQYHKDWMEWPWRDGAPFDDVNGNSFYEPDIDIPGVKGADQTIWFVANDLDAGSVNYAWGCNPIGVEMQATIWGYAREDALGNMLFRKYVLINKSTTVFDSMYVAMWTDPDLGNSADDLVGCDTTRSLGFVYNGYETDIAYAPLPPPSVGFDFFQGPVVPASPADSAIFLGKRVNGKRNLPMTAFFAFDITVPDESYWDPDWGIPQQINNIIRGFTRDGKPWKTPDGTMTKFPFSGDPASQTGWLDGQLFPAGDRRFGLSSGPFTMAPGDTQEVVVAEIAAGAEQGVDRLTAVSLLKFYDDQAQLAYDNFFELPTAPQAPIVTVTPLDREVVLSWGDSLKSVSATENVNIKGYAFQGYNVYQLPSPSAAVSDGKKLVTYDLADGIQKIKDRAFDPVQGEVITAVKQFGTDSGIRRYLRLTTDPFTNNNPLVNGAPYYYAVTAYNYNPDPLAVPRTLENPIKTYTVYPHAPDPGVRYNATFGDTLKNVAHTSNVAGGALSNGRVVAQVVNPTLLTGATYSVVFGELNGKTVWHLVRTQGSKRDTVARNLADQTGSDEGSPMIDGIIFRVFTVTPTFQKFTVVSNANGPLVPPDMGCFAFNDNGFPTLDGLPPNNVDNDRPSSRQQVGGGKWGIHTGGTTDDASFAGRFIPRTTRNGANWPWIIPWDWEIRFTAAGGKANTFFTDGTTIDVPFELWNIGIGTPDDPSDDYRVIPLLNDANGNHVFDLDGADNSISGGDNDPETDWIYWYNPVNKAPGHAGYDAVFAKNTTDFDAVGDEVMARMVLVNWNGGSVSDPTFPANVNQQMPETGTVFRMLTAKPNQSNDVFTIVPPANSYDVAQARSDIAKINVFPNPYYGVNPQEQDKYLRFVTFSHLPARATIRIFNLAGVMVRRIDKESSSQFERWDLKNEEGLPVGSGLYIAHIDMPDLGVNKILKIAVVQEQQILDRY